MRGIAAILSTALLFTVVVCCPAVAQEELPGLDKDLLEDLDSDLLKGLEDLPGLEPEPDKAKAASKPGSKNNPAGASSAADDAQKNAAANPLIRISEQMRKVESRLASADTSEQTQKIQQDILQELSVVIQQLQQQQKQQQQQPSSGGQKQQQSKPTSKKPSEGGKPQGSPSQEPSNKPARDSSDDVRKPEEVEAENRELQQMLKEVWGHLPDRVRQQMMNARVEQLLPKYQKLIEEYYKRLAEDREN